MDNKHAAQSSTNRTVDRALKNRGVVNSGSAEWANVFQRLTVQQKRSSILGNKRSSEN